MTEDKGTIDARLLELLTLKDRLEITERGVYAFGSAVDPIQGIKDHIREREVQLEQDRSSAHDPIMESVIRSHKAICKAKNMGEKDAYGHDPAIYYALGICSEAGELANDIVRAGRSGQDRAKTAAAVASELPDVVIYSFVLAYVLDLDLTKLVNEKVDAVIKRAEAGYYGGPLKNAISG